MARLVPLAPSGDPRWSGDAPDPATSRAPYRIFNIGNNNPVELMTLVATHRGRARPQGREGVCPDAGRRRARDLCRRERSDGSGRFSARPRPLRSACSGSSTGLRNISSATRLDCTPTLCSAVRRRAANRRRPTRLLKPAPGFSLPGLQETAFCQRTPEPSPSSGSAMSACRWPCAFAGAGCEVIGFDLERDADCRTARRPRPDARSRAGAAAQPASALHGASRATSRQRTSSSSPCRPRSTRRGSPTSRPCSRRPTRSARRSSAATSSSTNPRSIPARRRRTACRCWSAPPASSADRISPSATRPSASTRATRATGSRPS